MSMGNVTTYTTDAMYMLVSGVQLISPVIRQRCTRTILALKLNRDISKVHMVDYTF